MRNQIYGFKWTQDMPLYVTKHLTSKIFTLHVLFLIYEPVLQYFKVSPAGMWNQIYGFNMTETVPLYDTKHFASKILTLHV